MFNEAKYLKNSAHCPYCGSSNVESAGIDPTGLTTAVDEVTCLNCDAVWCDSYEITGAFEVSPPTCPYCGGDCPSGDDGCDEWKAKGLGAEDLANDDKFECASCNIVFDIEDSCRVGDLLVCETCANR